MAIRHAVWHSDKVYKYKWQAALSCAINAFNERMAKPKAEPIPKSNVKDPWKVNGGDTEDTRNESR